MEEKKESAKKLALFIAKTEEPTPDNFQELVGWLQDKEIVLETFWVLMYQYPDPASQPDVPWKGLVPYQTGFKMGGLIALLKEKGFLSKEEAAKLYATAMSAESMAEYKFFSKGH